MTKLMSFDTSTQSTGYAIFVDGKYRRSGCIQISDNDKLTKMIEHIYSLIIHEDPDIIVVEEMVVVRNAQVARHLTMILGAIFGKCLDNGIYYSSIRPTEWRKLIDPGKKPRKRAELKEWSIQKVKELFDIDGISDDIADAILIGQAYINKWL